MREVTNDLWDFFGKEGFVVCITTNGFVKKDGTCVMGRGCAKEATERIPNIAFRLGQRIRTFGNITFYFQDIQLISFPVKHYWWNKADIDLIKQSTVYLADFAAMWPDKTFILPRPGCGNGKLDWKDVKPILEGILPDNVLVVSK
jgi:hypothetical protein